MIILITSLLVYKMSYLLTENVFSWLKCHCYALFLNFTVVFVCFFFNDGLENTSNGIFYAFSDFRTEQWCSDWMSIIRFILYCGNRLYFCNFIYLGICNQTPDYTPINFDFSIAVHYGSDLGSVWFYLISNNQKCCINFKKKRWS